MIFLIIYVVGAVISVLGYALYVGYRREDFDDDGLENVVWLFVSWPLFLCVAIFYVIFQICYATFQLFYKAGGRIAEWRLARSKKSIDSRP